MSSEINSEQHKNKENESKTRTKIEQQIMDYGLIKKSSVQD